MSAVADLLVFAEQHRIGVTFLPDAEGWSVGYKHGTGSGDLSHAHDLHAATVTAFRPLIDLVNRLEENRRC